MKLEVTEKDILLLKIVISALIVFLMLRFVIMPAFDTYQKNEFALEDANVVAEEMQSAIDRAGVLEKSIIEKAAELEKSSASYYAYMENREIDQLITGIALDNDLFPVSLSITAGVPKMLAPYHTSVAEEASATAQEAPETVENYIYIGEVDLVLEGTKAEAWDFLDDISDNYPALQVCSFDMEEKTYVNESLQTVNQLQITCKVAIYMHKNIEEIAAVGAEG